MGKKNPGICQGVFFDYLKMIHNAVTVRKIFSVFQYLIKFAKIGYLGCGMNNGGLEMQQSAEILRR